MCEHVARPEMEKIFVIGIVKFKLAEKAVEKKIV